MKEIEQLIKATATSKILVVVNTHRWKEFSKICDKHNIPRSHLLDQILQNFLETRK